jgi:hypothetical protein
MLKAGKSQAEVADAVGLTKSSIGKLALRKGWGRRGPPKAKKLGAKHGGSRRAVYEWCDGCRHRVLKPCIYCRDVAALEAKRLSKYLG